MPLVSRSLDDFHHDRLSATRAEHQDGILCFASLFGDNTPRSNPLCDSIRQGDDRRCHGFRGFARRPIEQPRQSGLQRPQPSAARSERPIAPRRGVRTVARPHSEVGRSLHLRREQVASTCRHWRMIFSSVFFPEETMVLTKSELLASLQNEVRILLHLASKIDPATARLPSVAKAAQHDRAAEVLERDGARTGTGRQGRRVRLCRLDGGHAGRRGARLRSDGRGDCRRTPTPTRRCWPTCPTPTSVPRSRCSASKTTRGAFIVNLVLCGCAAYRTQLFLYLKASGREELSTMNLWGGVDAPVAV